MIDSPRIDSIAQTVFADGPLTSAVHVYHAHRLPFVRLRRACRKAAHHQHSPGCQGGNQRRSEEHTSELQSPCNLVCRLLLEKKKNNSNETTQYSATYLT